jgi:hypothetical protein
VINRRITHRTLRTECWTSEFWEGNGRSGNYIGPEIGFEEIAIDLLQARLSGLKLTDECLTNRPLSQAL